MFFSWVLGLYRCLVLSVRGFPEFRVVGCKVRGLGVYFGKARCGVLMCAALPDSLAQPASTLDPKLETLNPTPQTLRSPKP